jgi:NADH-quinone oxidoreductase subunit M
MKYDFPFAVQFWAFIAFFIAFAIKVPMFPFHTWLPDAHVEAPTAGSIILAGVLLKMGTYGLIRFNLTLFEEAARYFTPLILVMSVIGIIYGGYLALAQTDIKKLIAYSSISHMGFVTLGLFVFNSAGVEGAIMQMLNHGITTGALFLCIGLIYERTHTRELADYGGLAKAVPIYTTFFTIFILSSLAIPGTNSFIGEFLILTGAFGYSKVAASFSIIGALLGAVYLLGMYKKVALGEINHKGHIHEARDVNGRELIAMAALAIFVFWIGLNATPFMEMLHPSVNHLLEQLNVAGAIVANVK